MGEEADALTDQHDGTSIELEYDIERYISDYNIAKSAAVGCIVNCPVCRKQFKKSRPDQAFAPGHRKCKDRYHNTTNPDRRERAKRFYQGDDYDESW